MNSIWRAAAIIALLVAFVAAQSARSAGNAEDAFKNIQSLRGTPADSFVQGMHLMTADLGVTCEYCHVDGDFASDAVPKKKVARNMIEMTSALNRASFDSAQVITCYTCHRGSAVPQNTPGLPLSSPQSSRVETTLPSVDEILAKYIAALGGERALLGIHSRVIRASQDIATGPGGTVPVPAMIQEYRKAPDRWLNIARTANAEYRSGYDGAQAWSTDAKNRVTLPAALDQFRAKRNADIYEPLHIKQEYSRLVVTGIETIGSRSAFVVVGYPQEGVAVRLFFDSQSGLLLRTYTTTPTEVGDSPYQEDYSDYRPSPSGVKYPYRIDRTPAALRTELLTHSTILVQDIQENVEIEDSKFLRPASSGAH